MSIIIGFVWAISILYRSDCSLWLNRPSFFWSNTALVRPFVNDDGTAVFTKHWSSFGASDCDCIDATFVSRHWSRISPPWCLFVHGISNQRTLGSSNDGSSHPPGASISDSRYRRRFALIASCLSRTLAKLDRDRGAWWDRPSSDPIPVRNCLGEVKQSIFRGLSV